MKSRPADHRRTNPSARAEKPAQRRSQHAALRPDRVIYGLHAAEAALSNARRTIRHAYLTENAAAKLSPFIAARAIPTSLLHPSDFDALIGAGAVHQGAVLDAEPLQQPGLDEFLDGLLEGAPAVLAMLDQVTDPHNVGAVLRSAAAFGISALIVQDRHSPPLTGVLVKAASGAIEHVPVIGTVNLARALDRLKDRDFVCIGFDSEATHRFDAASAYRTAFVFGAEDRGLRRLVREGCDTLYTLSAPGKIKSLNISNAAAIVFYEAAKAHRPQ
ncbi:MAG: 23S rRNA (guanosine(2251)-2'-O)-methyltransferase RlmB [Rhodomicrobium sp.]